MGQETTVRTLHGTTDWFKIGKGVWQGCILSHCLFNLHAEWVSEWMKATELCPTIWDPMDYTVHGILQARVLEWVAIPFSRGSSQPRDQTQVSRIVGGLFFFFLSFFFTNWATKEAHMQSTSCEMPGWMTHKLESRFLGEISTTSDIQMISF